MSIFLTSSIGDNVVSALTSMNLWTAICKSIFIILFNACFKAVFIYFIDNNPQINVGY